MNPEEFELITNSIAVLLKDDADFIAYCESELGEVMTPIDNSITKYEHIPTLPLFWVTKGEAQYFFNKGTQSGESERYPINIQFGAKFTEAQDDDELFALPAGAKQTINGILTFTPTDVMRRIANMALQIINKKIECSHPQLRVETGKIFSTGYYDEEDGVVFSLLELTTYKENRGYN